MLFQIMMFKKIKIKFISVFLGLSFLSLAAHAVPLSIENQIAKQQGSKANSIHPKNLQVDKKKCSACAAKKMQQVQPTKIISMHKPAVQYDSRLPYLEETFTPAQQNFINSLWMTPTQKSYLLEYLATPHGQELLNQRMLHPLVGPTASNIFSPVAYGSPSGILSFGGGAINHWFGTSGADGYGVVGLGLGNADRYVGLQIYGIIDSLGAGRFVGRPNDPGFGRNGTSEFRVFRWLGQNTAVAVGAANATGWGCFRDYNPSYYAVGTQIFDLNPSTPDYPIPLTLSVGAGTGAFVSPIVLREERNNNSVNVFANGSLRVLPRLALVGDYTSQILSAGVSFIPSYYLPVIITCYAANLAGNKFPGPVSYGVNAMMGFKIF